MRHNFGERRRSFIATEDKWRINRQVFLRNDRGACICCGGQGGSACRRRVFRRPGRWWGGPSYLHRRRQRTSATLARSCSSLYVSSFEYHRLLTFYLVALIPNGL